MEYSETYVLLGTLGSHGGASPYMGSFDPDDGQERVLSRSYD